MGPVAVPQMPVSFRNNNVFSVTKAHYCCEDVILCVWEDPIATGTYYYQGQATHVGTRRVVRRCGPREVLRVTAIASGRQVGVWRRVLVPVASYRAPARAREVRHLLVWVCVY